MLYAAVNGLACCRLHESGSESDGRVQIKDNEPPTLIKPARESPGKAVGIGNVVVSTFEFESARFVVCKDARRTCHTTEPIN